MSTNEYKYNYVIFGCDGYYEVGYHDLLRLSNVVYLKNYMQTITNPIVKILTRLSFSQKVNKFANYPLRTITFPRLLSFRFHERRPLCFIFFGRNAFLIHSPYFDYLKDTNPNAKFILYMQDIVARTPELNIWQAKNQFDLIYSYNQEDCQQYNLIYYPTPYSYYEVPDSSLIPESDIYFCGKGKDRYPILYSIYKQCDALGLICDFHITDMPTAISIRGISTKPLSYIENLQHILKTKCIIEIMQSGADGFTPRVWESMFYNKHLLTNNAYIVESPYYRKGYTHLLHQDFESIKNWIYSPVKEISPIIQNNLSPINLLKHIESLL